ncbi:MAG: Fic family protein [Prevotella sp.]|jgi:Fic family protein
MIELPPQLNAKLVRQAMKLVARKDIAELILRFNDEYLYWTDIKYKNIPDDVSYEQIWAATKLSRKMQRVPIWGRTPFFLTITNRMQKLCHYFDMNFGGSWENSSVIPSEDRERYLISSLMEEAISSSQMEGASTTRKVAKEMLRKKVSPRNQSERMIANNFESIRFIVEHKDEALTPEMLLHIHALMTKDTLDDPHDEGRFRDNDDVVVANGITDEVVHTPPSYTEIIDYIDALCAFVNSDAQVVFIHPIIKAIVIHFLLAYLHPFVDGNGRTARALFYWYMLKNGYWLTEYLAISKIIYASKRKYEKAFLYVESDGYDLGYFITYHLRVLRLAFENLQNYIQRKIAQKQNNVDLFRLGNINERQVIILSLFRSNPKTILTVKEIENRFAVSHTTARTDLDVLVERGLLQKIAVNKVKYNYIKGLTFDKEVNSL